MTKEELFKYMRRIQWKLEGYLLDDIVKDKSDFILEAEAAKKVNDMIEGLEVLTRRDVELLIQDISKVEKAERHNGSAWYEYKLQLSNFLKKIGFEIEFTENRITLK